MAILVIGPSSVGKSTYIKKNLANTEVVFGWEVGSKEIGENAVVHYNLLHYFFEECGSLIEEKSLMTILGQKNVLMRVLVMVAPLDEINSRVGKRRIVEDTQEDSIYDNAYWSDLYSKVDLYEVYERLFQILDKESLQYDVIYSSESVRDGFAKTDRVYVCQNLKGKYQEMPSYDEVQELTSDPLCHYQEVLCPYGLKTPIGAYEHLPESRDKSIMSMLGNDFRGVSVLDIGSALGGFLFLCERYGAGRLLGVELNEKRYSCALRLSCLLKSNAEFLNESFPFSDFDELFDYVLCLNVIHHIGDFEGFLARLLQLVKKKVLIEFPTFCDPKFRACHSMSEPLSEALNSMPLVGVSSLHDVDQTYVYSPIGLISMLEDRFPQFTVDDIVTSPIEGRMMLSMLRR